MAIVMEVLENTMTSAHTEKGRASDDLGRLQANSRIVGKV